MLKCLGLDRIDATLEASMNMSALRFLVELHMDAEIVSKQYESDETIYNRKFSRNYGREPTFHILYSSRHFNTKKMKNERKIGKTEKKEGTEKKFSSKSRQKSVKEGDEKKKVEKKEEWEEIQLDA